MGLWLPKEVSLGQRWILIWTLTTGDIVSGFRFWGYRLPPWVTFTAIQYRIVLAESATTRTCAKATKICFLKPSSWALWQQCPLPTITRHTPQQLWTRSQCLHTTCYVLQHLAKKVNNLMVLVCVLCLCTCSVSLYCVCVFCAMVLVCVIILRSIEHTCSILYQTERR